MKKETEKQSPSNLFEGMVSIRAVLQAQGTAYNNRRILRILYAQENIARRPREYRFLCTMGEARCARRFCAVREDSAFWD